MAIPKQTKWTDHETGREAIIDGTPQQGDATAFGVDMGWLRKLPDPLNDGIMNALGTDQWKWWYSDSNGVLWFVVGQRDTSGMKWVDSWRGYIAKSDNPYGVPLGRAKSVNAPDALQVFEDIDGMSKTLRIKQREPSGNSWWWLLLLALLANKKGRRR